ncbi:MAG: OmpP1/FadL family transporter, partial [Polaribacter sp.]
MKKIITLAALFVVSIASYSQSLNYQNLAILFSQNDGNGTARFTSMSGAFGALGGDISSISINPAGISVYNTSALAATFNSRATDIESTYYGNSITNKNQFLNLSQAGAVLVFESAYNSNWSKFAIGFNYSIRKDFNNSFIVEGNNNVATFRNFPLDNNTPHIGYDFADSQHFTNSYTGKINEANIAFSSVYQNKLHVGLGLNFYDINFSQRTTLLETNNDGNGNTLDAKIYQENFTTGAGVSLNAGVIYKVTKKFRFGLSYQTPTWYTELIEDSNIINNKGFDGDTEISVSNSNAIYDNTAEDNFESRKVDYRLKTPSKLTTSAALIFGENGLLSIDYIYRNYQNMKLSNRDFRKENQFFKEGLRNTQAVNLGTE